MASFWSRNSNTFFFGLAGVTKSILDNYWVFTTLPLAAQDGNETTGKAFYMTGQILVGAILGAGLGKVLDYLRRMEMNRLTDEGYRALEIT